MWCWPQTHKHNRDTNQEDSASKILKEKVVQVVCTSEGGGEGVGGRDREKEREEGWIGMRRGRERGGGREGGRGDKEKEEGEG